MPEIDCWITLGSTYTYLTVMRFPQIEQRSGVMVRFRPFNLRAIFDALGYFPFPPDSPKTAYMWRDIERRAAMYGIPIRLPVSYPAKAVPLANKVALLGMQEGWGRDFIRAAYRRWFEEGQETGSEPNLSDSLRECGENPERVISIANGSEIDRLFAEETAKAKSLGLFGSPTFAVGKEIFWGDDRLEDAMSWAKTGRVVLKAY